MASSSTRATIRRTGTKPTIIAHRAFPFIVALWFAALLGLGSLVLPPYITEKLVVQAGLPSIISAAEPPLGFTARALIAAIATVAGALIGFFCARAVSNSSNRERGTASPNPASFVRRQPINAHEELGADSLDAAPGSSPISGRRRTLALSEDEGPSEYLQHAPMPGRDLDPEAEFDHSDEQGAATLDLTGTDEFPETIVHDLNHIEENRALREEPAFEQVREHQPFSILEEATPASVPDQEFVSLMHATDEPSQVEETEETVPEEPATAPECKQVFGQKLPSPLDDSVDNIVEDELVSNTEIASERFAEEAPESASTSADEDQSEPLAFSPPSLTARQESESEQAPTSPDVAQTFDGEAADLVQLVQQLGSTIEKHRQWSAHRAQTASAPAALTAALPQFVPDDFSAAPAEDAAQAMASFFSGPAAKPVEHGSDQHAQAQPNIDEPAREPASEQSPEPATDFTTETRPAASPASKVPQEFRPYTEESRSASPTPSGAVPTSLRLLGNGDSAEEDCEIEAAALAASFSLPITQKPRQVFIAPASPAENEVDDLPELENSAPDSETENSEDVPEENLPETDNGYASLKALQNPFLTHRETRIHIDEPEPEAAQNSVIFPGEAANPSGPGRSFDRPSSSKNQAGTAAPLQPSHPKVDAEETNRALREALLNLQKMGKAS